MRERRKERRIRVSDEFAIFDLTTKTYVGFLADISSGGFMARVSEDQDLDVPFELSILLPETINGTSQVRLTAQCVWCAKRRNGPDYAAGFTIVDISPDDAALIEAIKEDYVFSVIDISH